MGFYVSMLIRRGTSQIETHQPEVSINDSWNSLSISCLWNSKTEAFDEEKRKFVLHGLTRERWSRTWWALWKSESPLNYDTVMEWPWLERKSRTFSLLHFLLENEHSGLLYTGVKSDSWGNKIDGSTNSQVIWGESWKLWVNCFWHEFWQSLSILKQQWPMALPKKNRWGHQPTYNAEFIGRASDTYMNRCARYCFSLLCRNCKGSRVTERNLGKDGFIDGVKPRGSSWRMVV